MPSLKGVALAVLLLLIPPPSAVAQSVEEVVAGIEGAYARIADFRADFTQQAFNRSLGQSIKADGSVYVKRPGKMRWEYRTPSVQQIVSDGQSLWVYTPELNQVNVGEAPRALAGPAGSFLAGLGKVSEEFRVRFLNPAARTDEDGNLVLDLTPRRPTPVLARLILSVDPRVFLARKAVLYDQFDNTVTMLFTRVTVNPGLQDGLFTFTPPRGVAVMPLDPLR
jgi:outer membrane lipoprotein carrier protein